MEDMGKLISSSLHTTQRHFSTSDRDIAWLGVWRGKIGNLDSGDIHGTTMN